MSKINNTEKHIHIINTATCTPNVKDLACIAGSIDSFNMKMYDLALSQEQGSGSGSNILTDLNQFLIKFIRLLIVQRKGGRRKESQRNQSRVTMSKISILCCCLNMIYSRCSWSGLHSLLQNPSLDSNKVKMKMTRRNTVLNSMWLVIGSILHNEKKTRMRRSNKNMNINTTSSTAATATATVTITPNNSNSDGGSGSSNNDDISRSSKVAFSKVLGALARMSSVANISSSTKNMAKVIQYMIDTLKSDISHCSHCNAVTIVANLVNVGGDSLPIRYIENMLEEVVRHDKFRNVAVASSGDDDKFKYSKIFQQEAWRLILHLVTFDNTRSLVAQRRHVMQSIHSIISHDDVCDRIIGVAILKKLGCNAYINQENILDGRTSKIIEDLYNRAWIDTDQRVIESSIFALCEIFRHQPKLLDEEKRKFIFYLSYFLVERKLCKYEVMQFYFFLTENIYEGAEECWKIIETLFILAHYNSEALFELNKLAKRVCKVQQSRLLSNIALALEKGTEEMKLLASIVLKELSDDPYRARLISKDEKISRAIVLVITSSSRRSRQHDGAALNCIKILLSISSSSVDMDDLVRFRDVLPNLIYFAMDSCKEDKRLMIGVRECIVQLSEATLLMPSYA